MMSKLLAYRLLFIALGLTSLFVWNAAPTQAAPVPVLIRDINTTIKDDSNIQYLLAAGSTLYFTASDRAHGRELWKSDGTAAGTAMVKDINVGEGDGAYPNYMVYLNGYIYFTSAHATYGFSFWRSDGTAAGTALVKDHFDASDTVLMNGKIYTTNNGSDLWVYDPVAGTMTAINEAISSVANMTVVGDRLFFSVGNNLWTSDGTTGGTVLLATNVYPVRFAAVGSTLFFRGWSSTTGYELWRSDGTVAGTAIVEDMVTGTNSGNPDFLTNLNGTLYFSATHDTSGSGLWKCTTAGLPVQVKSGISPSQITNINGTLYFRQGSDLWKSNGVDSAGTVLVKASVYPEQMTNVNGTLFIKGWSSAAHYELWKSNGTEAGTVLVRDINPGTGEGNPNLLTNVNGTLYFIATEPATGTQLWKSDGSEAGTVLVKNVSPGTRDSTPDHLSNVNGTLYFSAFDGDETSQHGTELWQTNGTLAATSMVQDISPGWGSSSPQQITDAGGTIYFVANNNELWKRVGTGAAVMVKDNAYPDQLTWVSGLNLLFFEGWDSTNGYELWKSDGSEAGTAIVKNINPTSDSGINRLVSFGNALYFIATDASGARLWKSDGSEGGTVPVRSDITGVSELVRVNDRLFFAGNDATHSHALWVSDGTAAGTVVLGTDHYPSKLIAVGNTLYYQGWTNVDGYLLWKSDGSTISPVADFDSSTMDNFTNVNGTLYLTVWNTSADPDAMEIWKIVGDSPVKVKSLVTGWNGYVTQLTSVHGLLAFVFDDQVNGAELWTSDGTEAGTKMVKDLFPDPSGFGSSPGKLTMAVAGANVQNEALFFSAIDETAGRELYILDFTSPVSAITSPANNAYLRGSTATISGTSSDSMTGSGVNLVEVSTDGSIWHNATNTSAGIPWASWQYTWTLPVDGVYTIRSRATDLATNVQTPLASITVTVDNTKPVVNFSITDSILHVLNALMTYTFNVTEANPDVYCINNVNSPAGCGWISSNNLAIMLTTEGNKSFYAWARDKAGNVSDLTGASSDSIMVSLPHTLNIDLAGDGGGTVSYESQVFDTDHSVTVYTFDQITLVPEKYPYSIFNGWSGVCSGTGNCNYTVPTVAAVGSSHSAIATFNIDWPHAVKVLPNNTFYQKISDAYKAESTDSGATIRAWGSTFDDTLLFNLGKQVILVGGDNEAHNDNSAGMTTVPGPMTVQSGAVTIEKLVIK